jgi:phosphatidylglycerophosphatase A
MSVLAAPNVGFLLRHPAHFIALGFGAGLVPVASGTFGTLLAIPIAAVLRTYLSDALFGAAIVMLALVGVWAAQVAGRNLGVSDHGRSCGTRSWRSWWCCFSSAAKCGASRSRLPSFVFSTSSSRRRSDSSTGAFKNGAGVMADDLLAAGYTLVVLAILYRLVGP